MLEIKFTLEPGDPRFAAVVNALASIGITTPSVSVAEAPKAAKAKAPIEKPEVTETTEGDKPKTDEKPVTLEAIREKITEYTGKDKAAYTPKIKALLDKYGQKSASNLLKTDYPAFYTELCAL